MSAAFYGIGCLLWAILYVLAVQAFWTLAKALAQYIPVWWRYGECVECHQLKCPRVGRWPARHRESVYCKDCAWGGAK